MHTSFVHLHVHSEYSLLDSTARIVQLVEKAAQLGMPALALTDHATLYGAIPFYKACRAKGIKPIIGMEIYLIDGDLHERVTRQTPPPYHLTLLAETEHGYRNLLKLSTIAQTEGYQLLPRINKEVLSRHTAGLIALSGCTDGEVAEHLLAGDLAKAQQTTLWYEQVFGAGNFYLECQEHGREEQRRLNQLIYRLHQETGIPLVATNNVHYVEKSQAKLHDVLLAIGAGKTVDETDRLRYEQQEYYLKSGEEMATLFTYAPEALNNTWEIAKRCEVTIELNQQILPRFPLPSGVHDPNQFLKRLCEKGCLARYGDITEEIRERLEHELSIIIRTGFTDYFLIVWDFMRYAHENGIPTGPGRGSAAGSLVAYALRITNVDPLAYNLLFERFLNPERITMPDIDIDFSVERRDEVIHYVANKYGRDRVAQIITFGTLAARAAVRDSGRALALSTGIIDRVAKLIPSALGITIEKALQVAPDLKKLATENTQVAQLIQVAQGLEGLPRHASTHAAGVVISREPLTQYVPLQQGNDGLALTQYPMDILEEVGLLKMDFLGLRNLTIIQETLHQIKAQGVQIDINNLPHPDENTFRAVSRGETTGIFQLESSGIRNVLRDLKPSSLDDIIAVLALYRPGPMEIIPQYIQAKHGRSRVTYPHPDLESILKETHGFIIYQEQIMQIASTLAGFSLGEADVLRRAVGKKKRELLAEQRAKFVIGATLQGYDDKLAHDVYDLIVKFADYGFNKAHSVAYAIIAYQMAYLKATYPLAFMAVLLSQSIGSQTKIAEYVEEAKRLRLPVLPPDVNESGAFFSVNRETIRFGLAAVKNVGYGAIESIVQERQQGPYRDLIDFCSRVDSRLVNRRVIESLILCGAFDSLPGHRAQLLLLLDEALEKGTNRRTEREEAQINLFHSEESNSTGTHIEPSSYPDVPSLSRQQRLQEERDLLGVYLSGHPLDEFPYLTSHPDVTTVPQLAERKKDQLVKIVGMVVEIKRIQTKKGDPMAFLTVEDKASLVEVVIFPPVFAKCESFLEKERIVVIEGRVDHDQDTVKLLASRIWDAKSLPKPTTETVLFIKITPAQEHDSTLTNLQKIFVEKKGTIPVILYYESRKEARRLPDTLLVEADKSFLEQIGAIVGHDSVIQKEMPKNVGG